MRRDSLSMRRDSEDTSTTQCPEWIGLQEVGLPISLEGQLCIVQASDAMTLVSLAHAVSETLNLNGKPIKFFDVKSCSLDTDDKLCDSIREGLTPLFATACDSAPSMYVEELIHLQFKSVRLQMASLWGRMAEELRIGLERVLGKVLIVLSNSLGTVSDESKEWIGHFSERLDSMTTFANDEKHLRENIVQDMGNRLQAVSVLAESLSTRLCDLEQQSTIFENKVNAFIGRSTDQFIETQDSVVWILNKLRSDQTQDKSVQVNTANHMGDLERHIVEKLQHFGSLLNDSVQVDRSMYSQSPQDVSFTTPQSTPQKKVNFISHFGMTGSLSVPRGSMDTDVLGRHRCASPRPSPRRAVTRTAECNQRPTEPMACDGRESSPTARLTSRGSAASEGVCSTISDIPGSVVIATAQKSPPSDTPTPSGSVSPRASYMGSTSNGPAIFKVPASGNTTTPPCSGQYTMPHPVGYPVVSNNLNVSSLLPVSSHNLQLVSVDKSPPCSTRPSSVGASSVRGTLSRQSVLMTTADTTPGSRPGTPRSARPATVAVMGARRHLMGTRSPSMSRRSQQLLSTRASR